jgi:hypothetical protein
MTAKPEALVPWARGEAGRVHDMETKARREAHVGRTQNHTRTQQTAGEHLRRCCERP